MSDSTRSYRSPLREAQADATRRLILDTLAEMVADRGAADVSIRDLAAGAGTSERTVYRHFPDRDALFDALIEQVSEELDWDHADERVGLRTYADLPRAVERSFLAFEDEEVPTRVAARMSEAMGRSSRDTRQRTDRHRELLTDLFPDLAAQDRDRLLGLLRTLISSRIWLRLKDDFGMDGAESGPLVRWVVQLVLDDVAATGRVPGPSSDEGSDPAP